MTKIHITIIAMLTMLLNSAHAQDSSQNYVKTVTMLNAERTDSIPVVQYYNGLGYPTVSVGVVGGSGQTAYTLTTYDGVGREDCKYLPVSTGYSLDYKDPETVKSKVESKYDAKAFSQTTYDALDRPLSVTTPGTAFSQRPAEITYSTNTSSDGVKRYGISNDEKLTRYTNYKENMLTKETSKDPDGNTVVTFKDLSGKVIMQRTINGSSKYDTYYVYDALGLLRFVLPPKCTSVNEIAVTGYQYEFDKRGRMITKILPGCDSIKYWYDSRDRMICMQDPRLESAGKYRFFIYDKFNHLVVQGVCTSCNKTGTIFNATFNKNSVGILGTSYVLPAAYTDLLENAELEIANYYDKNQDNIKDKINKYFEYFSDIKITTSVSQTGQLTGSVMVASNGEFIAQVMVYDLKGNLTNSKTKELGGRITSNETKYSFTNKVSFSETYVSMPVGGALVVTETYGYNTKIDKMSSYLLSLKHGDKFRNYISYTYNELGQLKTVNRTLPSNVTRTVDYAYDMHGWLKSIKTNSFKEYLYYADCKDSNYKCYNGNISSIEWQDAMSSGKIRGYKFSYDGANRMTDGIYGEGNNLATNKDNYTEKMKYDANGNIETVTRYGQTTSGSYGLMDNLTITYNGNQPKSVSETVTDNNKTGSFEYKKKNGYGYIFDTSGSLVADKSRGIAYITYDLNNNPDSIFFTNGSMTKYVYSASGQKLRVVHYTAMPNMNKKWGDKPDFSMAQIQQKDSTEYLLGGSLIMRNEKIDKYLFEGGYAQASAVPNTDKDKFAFNYYNQDHLGNNREVVDGSGNVTQVTNYYPFGAPYADATASKGSDVQPYKYNGKELDLMHGLNTYDYGARQHDPILARWDRIDPLCEKYYSTSPYAYCVNNPINAIDPDGRYVAYFEGDKEWIYNSDEQAFFCGGVKFDGDNENLSSLTKALNKLYGTCDEMTSVIDDKKNGVEIGIHNKGRDKNGEGVGQISATAIDKDANIKSHISWNPKASSYGGNPTVSLGHELAHSYDRFNGITDLKKTDPEFGVSHAEAFATHVENKIRSSLGIVLRGYYYPGDDGPSQGKLITKGRQSVYFDDKERYVGKYVGKDKKYHPNPNPSPYVYAKNKGRK